MERYYRTMVKNSKLNGSMFILGRISGIMAVTCRNQSLGVISDYGDEGKILVVKCTAAQYLDFRTHVEKLYPGFCTFDFE